MNLFEIFGYPLFIVAGLQIYLGALLLRRNRRTSPLNRSVAAFSFFSAAYVLSNAVAYIRASVGQDFGFFFRTAWIGWFSVPAALQLLFYLRDEKSRAARRIGLVLYPFWTVVLCLTLFTDLVEPGDYSLIPYVNRKGPLEDPLRAAGSLMILWIMVEIVRLRRQVSGVRKAQLNYFFHGTLIFAAGGVLVVGLVQIMDGFGVSPALGAYFSFPWVALTFYAITRHRLFDIRLVISGTLTVAVLSVLFFASAWQLFEMLRPALGVVAAMLVAAPLLGFLFFGSPLTRGVNQWIQQIIVKGKYDYQLVLKQSMNAITSILDLDELLGYIIGNIRKNFGAESVRLFLRNEEGAYVLYPDAGGPGQRGAPPLPEDVLRALRKTGQAVLRQELEAVLPESRRDDMKAFLDRNGDELFIPLLFKGELRGVLTMGEKRDGEPYRQSDIGLLETLAGHAAVAMENALLYEEAARIKQSLLQSEARFRALAETTPAAIFIYQDGRFLYANPAGESISGYRSEEFAALRFQDIVHPAYRDLVQNLRPAHLRPGRSPQQYEFKIVRKDGDDRWVLMTAGFIEYEGRGAVIGTLFDITERVALEARLRNVQKMEAIGKLAGGVAHDFNNILTSIVGHGALLQMKMAKDAPLRKHADEIMASTERAANLTQSLLAFGRKQAVNLQSAELNDIVRGMEKLLVGMIGENIRLNVRLAPDSLAVAADSGQMDRVIMNLVVNARDAMPSGGTLTIGTGVTAVDDEFIKVHGYVKKGTYAVLSVSDTGVGMDEQTKQKIFEPFFTTKKEGKGTGFGLAIAYEIVKLHNGYITVESEPGKGAAFLVFLPLLAQAALQPQAEYAAAGLEGTETVLVADDDDGNRKQTCAVLAAGGYSVVEATDGEEAVARFRENADGISLAVLDIMMPRMNGAEVCGALRKNRPEMKALFMSGYTEDILFKKGLLTPGEKFILKPFTPKDLLRRVREMLDERA